MADADPPARTISLGTGVAAVDAAAWDALAGGGNPFVSHAFLALLEESGSVGPGTGWQAAPILVKVFELKSSGNFETADYFALQDRDRETLAAELVNADQAILRSGEERTFKREAGLDSRAIGVIAGYRKLENARWRLVLPLKEPKQTNLYKVWQFSPSEQKVRIVIRKSGIELLPTT